MKAGDNVIYRRCYREGKANRGWKWYEYPAQIISRKKRSAVIRYVKHGQHHITQTSIDRLRQEENTCHNGNHESKEGVCIVDGGLKPE